MTSDLLASLSLSLSPHAGVGGNYKRTKGCCTGACAVVVVVVVAADGADGGVVFVIKEEQKQILIN